MEALAKIANTAIEKPQPSSAGISLSTRPGPPLPADTAQTIQRLWLQTVAAYPNQTLPEGTPDMYLVKWEAMVLRYGAEMFRDGLSKAIDDSRFFPVPEDIATHCQAIARDRRERAAALKAMSELEDWKAQCEREREEDERNGPREKSETEKRLDTILSAAKSDRRAK